jgi:hypothetical protein
MIRPRYCFPTRMFATLFVVLTRGTPRYRSEFQRMKRTLPLRPSAIPGSMLGQATHRRTPATLPRDRPHSHTLVQSHLQLRPPYPHPRPANASLQSQVAPEKSSAIWILPQKCPIYLADDLVANGKTGPKEVKHPPKRSWPDPILRVCALCGFSSAGRRAI